MSTRARKSGPAAGQSSRPSDTSPEPGIAARARSTSPVMTTRVAEKNELASLNDRLIVYIDRIRHLGADNARLTKVSSELEETMRREVSGVKSIYDKEIAEARRLLDQLAQEKAKYQLEVSKLQSLVEDLKAKLLTKGKSEEDLQQRLLAAEAQINELKARSNDSNNKHKRVDAENTRLLRELDSVSKQLAVVKRDQEAEAMMRHDCENRIKNLQSELSLKERVHRKEMEDTATRRQVEIQEVDGRLQQEYENRLAESLQQIRDENSEIIRRNREEVEAFYEKRLGDTQNASKNWQDAAQKAQVELQQSQKQCKELTTELSRQTAQVSSFKSRLEQLERQLRMEQDEHQVALAGKDAEIVRLQTLVEDQLQEYRDLLDMKIQLDTEIAAYRKLLELEESRLNMPSSSSGSMTSSCDTSVEPLRKRKHIDVSGASTSYRHSSASTSGSYVTVSTADFGIEIRDVDTSAKFIRLYNNTDKNITLMNWLLKQTHQDDEVVYKLGRGAAVKPHQYLTVWSQGSSPPSLSSSDIVMKSQSWLRNDEDAKVVLVDSEGKEVARRERSYGVRTNSPFSEDSGIEREMLSKSPWRITSLFTAFM